jgi:hypothetical protein
MTLMRGRASPIVSQCVLNIYVHRAELNIGLEKTNVGIGIPAPSFLSYAGPKIFLTASAYFGLVSDQFLHHSVILVPD